MSPLPLAVAPPYSAPEFPHWMLWGILVCFLAAFGVTVWAVFFRQPHYDPFEAPGEALDETDVLAAITDPNLPAMGYERPEPATQVIAVQYGPPAETRPIYGVVVEQSDWTRAMTVPAPPIVAQPTSLADEWIDAFERGHQPDPDAFSRRMLAGAGA